MSDTQATTDTERPTRHAPRRFERSTGAHTIVYQIVRADIVTLLFTIALGAIIPPLVWTLLELISLGLHASLLLDLSVLLILIVGLTGWAVEAINSHNLSKSGGCGTAGAVGIIVIIITILIISKLAGAPRMATPASWFPAPLVPIALTPVLKTLAGLGGAGAALLSIGARIAVLTRYRAHLAEQRKPLARAYEDGDAWIHMEAAYRALRKGLSRLDPPPFPHLKTPPTFLYYQAGDLSNPEYSVYWIGSELVVPAQFLTKEARAIFRPYLARQLYEYQSLAIRAVTALLACAKLAAEDENINGLLGHTLAVAKRCGQRWLDLENKRVIDRDRFAFYLGEAKHLYDQLVSQRAELKMREVEDNTLPSLTERLDYLLSLSRKEQRQVDQLLATLPAGPPSGEETTSSGEPSA